jgi:large subunit ribosomal protein L32e
MLVEKFIEELGNELEDITETKLETLTKKYPNYSHLLMNYFIFENKYKGLFNYQLFFEDWSPEYIDMLKKRKAENIKRPKFKRYLRKRFMRLSQSWRRPRGVHNKKRKRIKSKGKRPLIGYRGPKLTRGANAKGYPEKLCYTRADIIKVPSTHMIVLSGKLGLRKKIEYENLADSMGRYIVNKFNWSKYKS